MVCAKYLTYCEIKLVICSVVTNSMICVSILRAGYSSLLYALNGVMLLDADTSALYLLLTLLAMCIMIAVLRPISQSQY